MRCCVTKYNFLWFCWGWIGFMEAVDGFNNYCLFEMFLLSKIFFTPFNHVSMYPLQLSLHTHYRTKLKLMVVTRTPLQHLHSWIACKLQKSYVFRGHFDYAITTTQVGTCNLRGHSIFQHYILITAQLSRRKHQGLKFETKSILMQLYFICTKAQHISEWRSSN